MNAIELLARDSSPSRRPGPSSVVVIDDDVSVRESIRYLLLEAGWRAEVFESAEDFLQWQRQRVPTCLIVDVNLPRLGGLELQKQLAIDGDASQIVFISGYGDVRTTVRAMKAGAVEFLEQAYRRRRASRCGK